MTNAAVLPAELRGDAAAIPQLTEASDAAFKEYAAALKQQAPGLAPVEKLAFLSAGQR